MPEAASYSVLVFSNAASDAESSPSTRRRWPTTVTWGGGRCAEPVALSDEQAAILTPRLSASALNRPYPLRRRGATGQGGRPAFPDSCLCRMGLASKSYRASPLMVDGVLYSTNGVGLVQAFHPGNG